MDVKLSLRGESREVLGVVGGMPKEPIVSLLVALFSMKTYFLL